MTDESDERIRHLPDRQVDVIGDVHGEIGPLRALLGHLGYTQGSRPPAGRKPIFIGDLTDRGPESPAVVALVREMVQAGRAHCLLGNHELNLLREAEKDGNGWAFEDNHDAPRNRYPHSRNATAGEREQARAFFRTLPIALENEDLRIVHACWHPAAMAKIRALDPALDLAVAFDHFENQIEGEIRARGWDREANAEMAALGDAIEDRNRTPAMQPAMARADEVRQMGNPFRILTSGVERIGRAPFFSSGKWRFVDRVGWWDEYEGAQDVIVGHYWRWPAGVDRKEMGKEGPDLFDRIPTNAWLGPRQKVFCVDYGVGRRFVERAKGQPVGRNNRLAALRWPERELVFDDGERMATTPVALP